ncbi:hypothetical protein CLCR_04437 [Cladophialophora carrionii]|uniref:Uncharacterized protein n=1 Tax=Cladophialophora carrionii TaxID=86049 RepID=A0A1C1CI51_9EURO|nr:hypothetical protein CLCR_04437 [Cladophialophora carrionii]
MEYAPADADMRRLGDGGAQRGFHSGHDSSLQSTSLTVVRQPKTMWPVQRVLRRYKGALILSPATSVRLQLYHLISSPQFRTI